MAKKKAYDVGYEIGSIDSEKGEDYDESNYGLGETIGKSKVTKWDRTQYRMGYKDGFSGEGESPPMSNTTLLLIAGGIVGSLMLIIYMKKKA